MKNIVIYYSNNGSNRFIANKISEYLNCEIEEIRPVFNAHLLLLTGINPGIKKINNDLSAFDRVIMVGPIWMGKFINPLKAFIRKYNRDINKLVFVTCCGSDFELKDKKYGHGLVFKSVREIIGDRCEHCEAFPVTLLMSDEEKEVPEKVMETRLTEENFNGEIRKHFDIFIEKLKA